MPRQPDPSWHDGIHGVRPEEFPSLQELVETVFYKGIVKNYPHCYALHNAENLRVVVENGKVISHIGAIQRYFSIFGCTVRVASLGGVATYPEHRGRGHATRLFEDNLRKYREDRVDFVLVSGYRKMYHRFGCRYVGKDWAFLLKQADAPRFDDPSVELIEATEEDVPQIAEIYRHEPVRWLRPEADYRHAMQGYVMNRPAKFHLVRESGKVRAYVIVLRSRKDPAEPKAMLGEFAGDRKAIVRALGKVMSQHELEELGIHVLRHDQLMRELLEERGLEASPINSSGTVMLVDFLQFMERMRPYFEERLGTQACDSLVFLQKGEKHVFSYGGEQVVAENNGQAVQIIFGTLEGVEEPLLAAGGRCGELLRQVFPLPAPWYGVNYV